MVLTSPHRGEADGEPTGPASGRPDDTLRETVGEGCSDYAECENPSPPDYSLRS